MTTREIYSAVVDTLNEYGTDSELVDLLSSSIINERNPVCYGSDLRWANHLYPTIIQQNSLF